MAGGKETPRQKMIGMMYLVLTALLAMNISKDVLNAFIQINRGLVKNSANSQDASLKTLSLLENWSDKEKAYTFDSTAHDMAAKADALVKYIVELKAHVLACSVKGSPDGAGFEEYIVEGHLIDIGDKEKVSKPDENQNTTGMLIGDEPFTPRSGPWSAVELREKLSAFANDCVNLSIPIKDLKDPNPTDITKKRILKYIKLQEEASTDPLGRAATTKALIENTFSFPDINNAEGKPEKWETALFYHTPLAAVIAHLSKLESDVLNAKNAMLNYLAASINASDLKFSDVTVAVVPKQSYILRGDSFVAEIYLAAYNKSSKTKVYMGGEVGEGAKPELFDYAGREAIVSGSDGKCKFKINESALGSHSHKGVIVYQDADGADKAIPFIIPPFIVGDVGGVVVSATQMNVFYTNVVNPVSVSVPGVDPSNIKVTMSGGSISSKGNGMFDVSCSSPGTATINVTAMINGKLVSQPAQTFRVKPLPTPVPKFTSATSMDNTLQLGGAKFGERIEAYMPDGFDFQGVNLRITKFSLSINGATKEFGPLTANGDKLTAEMKTGISKAKPGERLTIFDIVCDQNGVQKRMSNITVKLTP